MGTNEFDRHALLEELKPRYDTAIANAHRTRYVSWIATSPGQLGTYDFARKAFPIKRVAPYVAQCCQLQVTNQSDFATWPVTDEGLARQVADHRGSLVVKAFGYLESTGRVGPFQSRVLYVSLQTLQLLDRTGAVASEVGLTRPRATAHTSDGGAWHAVAGPRRQGRRCLYGRRHLTSRRRGLRPGPPCVPYCVRRPRGPRTMAEPSRFNFREAAPIVAKADAHDFNCRVVTELTRAKRTKPSAAQT